MNYFIMLTLTILGFSANAETVNLRCYRSVYVCHMNPNHSEECYFSMMSPDMGDLSVIDIKKTNNETDFEIWQGSVNETLRYPGQPALAYTASIKQDRTISTGESVTYIRIQFTVSDVKINGEGSRGMNVQYLNEKNKTGYDFTCWTSKR